MPKNKQNTSKGSTEIPRAVSRPATTTVRPSGNITTHGATESPQAVIRPSTPSGGTSGDSNK